MMPLAAIGLAAIFLIAFFAQTLMGLNNVTNLSTSRLADVETILKNNEKNAATIQSHVDEQYLSKATLFSYVLEEVPTELFVYDSEDADTHSLFTLDKDGNKIYLVDAYENPRYSVTNSPILKALCEENDVNAIWVYDEDGFCVATSGENWYTPIPKDPEQVDYPLSRIIDDKVDSAILQATKSEEGLTRKCMGYRFAYFTYEATDGVTSYASRSQYEDYLAKVASSTWTEPYVIERHRSLVKICVDQSSLDALFEVTSLSYILSNMHVYGEKSFFVAFDNSADHVVVYSPVSSSLGKKALDIGMSASAFPLTGVYNGFQKVNGVEYYQSSTLIGDYYIATAIPTDSIYEMRNALSLFTLLFSFFFIVFASGFYTVSSDRADEDYVRVIQHRDGGDDEGKKDTFMLTTPSGKKKTSSAVSRYYKTKWRFMSAEQKLGAILTGYMTVASILIIIAIVQTLLNKDSSNIFTYIFSGNWERGFNIFSITESLMIIILIATVTKIVQILVKNFCGTLGARVETTGNLVVSVLRYGGIIGGIFYCLYLFGFDTTSLLTSAGIFSLVIGLGAQSLISDIIAGVFIVFEGEFRVGDIVTIGDFRGQVLEIGLRTTKIVDAMNNIKIFNNSAISGVVNMTKEASYAIIDVGIEYGESLERVENVLKEAFPKIKKKLPEIVDGPYYKGVSELGNNAVVIKILALCEEKDRIQLARDLNREIFLVFNENNINIPFPQVTISQLKEKEHAVSKSERESAQEFVDQQKEASSFVDADDDED